MEIESDIFIRCERCGCVFGIHKDEIEFEAYVYDHGENGMGDEVEYRYDSAIECRNCGNEICFRISGFEYPVGAFNYEDYEIEGGDFIEEPHMIIVYSMDEFDPYDAILNYDRIQQLIFNIADDRQLIYEVSSREFEEIIERLFQDEGFETVLTQSTRILLQLNMKWANQLFFILNVKNTDEGIALELVLLENCTAFSHQIELINQYLLQQAV